jgi:MscS family membrane protein
MFEEILTKTYYANTISQWLLVLIYIFSALLIGKVLYWFSSNIIKKLTSKTKTKLDDIIIDMVEEPLIFGLIVFGMWLGIQKLVLSETALTWVWNVFQVLIVINVAWLLTRLFDSLFKEYLVPLTSKTETDLDDQLLPLFKRSVNIIIWTLAFIVALNNAGYNVGALIAGLGIGGIALAMAAKDTISNIFGGFTIYTDKPFKIGDRIIINDIEGNVREIGLRSTRVQKLDGRIVTIPNLMFTENPVENVSLEPSRKIVLNLGLTYDTDSVAMKKAMDILKDIAKKHEDLIKKDSLISFTSFGDFSLGILFIYYIKKRSNILETQSIMNLDILNQFNEAKLDFAFPTQTLYNIEQKIN